MQLVCSTVAARLQEAQLCCVHTQQRACASTTQTHAVAGSGALAAVDASRSSTQPTTNAMATSTSKQRAASTSDVPNAVRAASTAWKVAPLGVDHFIAAARSGSLLSVASIHAQNTWLRFGWVAVAGGCALGAYGAWGAVERARGAFVNLRNDRSFLASLVAGSAAGLLAYGVFHRQLVIRPATVHALAMRHLRDDAAVAEVLRLPLAAGQPVASIVSGGSVALRVRHVVGALRFGADRLRTAATLQWGLVPQWQSQRMHMAFPIVGPNGRAVVMLHAKKRWGRTSVRLLAVDVPSGAALGPETRIFVRGGDADLAGAGGAVLRDLRAPLLAAAAAATARDWARDDAADDAERAAQARAAAAQRAQQRREAGPRELAQGGGMYAWERGYWRVRYASKRLWAWARGAPASDV